MTVPPSIDIRAPELAEIEELVDLWSTLVDSQQVYGANLDPTRNEDVAREYFGRLVVEDGVRVASDGDAMVGFVSYELEPDQFERTDRVGIVENLFVSPELRNSGIGTGLLEAAERGLRSRGAESIQLEVLAGNADAQAFYDARGYRRHRVRLAKEVETDKANGTDRK